VVSIASHGVREHDVLLLPLPIPPRLATFSPRRYSTYISDESGERAARAHKINQTAATTPNNNKKPPTTPPAMGAASLENFKAEVEAGACEAATAVGTSTTLGGGLDVEMTVTTVTAPL
jgi:hypothetical protein